MNYFERKLPGIDHIHSLGPRTMEVFAQDELGSYDFDSIKEAYYLLAPEDFVTATRADVWVSHVANKIPKPTMNEIASGLSIPIVQSSVLRGKKAFLVPINDGREIVLGTELGNEKQFSIAHELGHVFMIDWLKLQLKDTCIQLDKQEALCELIALYFLRQHLLEEGQLPSLANISRTFDGEEYSLDWAVDLAMLHGNLPRTILFEDGTNHCFNCRYESPCFGEAVTPEYYQQIPDDIKEGGKWTSCKFIDSSLNMQVLGSVRSF